MLTCIFISTLKSLRCENRSRVNLYFFCPQVCLLKVIKLKLFTLEWHLFIVFTTWKSGGRRQNLIKIRRPKAEVNKNRPQIQVLLKNEKISDCVRHNAALCAIKSDSNCSKACNVLCGKFCFNK